MSINIGAESSRWAGLQIDLHSKYRAGHITADNLEWFNNLSGETRNALMAGEKPVAKTAPVAEPTEKFALLVDLGIITVPDDYNPATTLTSFGKKNRKKFYYYNDDITDEHFPNPSRILKPGDKLWVRAFRQVVSGLTTSEERMNFLRKQEGNTFVGAQGLAQVFEQKRDLLPKGKWSASFDEKDALWFRGGCHRVPCVYRYSDGDFNWDLGPFGGGWGGGCCLLCFCDLPQTSGA